MNPDLKVRAGLRRQVNSKEVGEAVVATRSGRRTLGSLQVGLRGYEKLGSGVCVYLRYTYCLRY